MIRNPSDGTASPTPRCQRRSTPELKAKYGDNWGIQQIDPVPNRPVDRRRSRAMTLEEVTRHYRTRGIGFRRKEEV